MMDARMLMDPGSKPESLGLKKIRKEKIANVAIVIMRSLHGLVTISRDMRE